MPYSNPPTTATTRGPFLLSQIPPKNAATPRTKMLIVNVRVTSEIFQPNRVASGVRKTLQAYTAPSATWITTPAKAITQRLFVIVFLRYRLTAHIVHAHETRADTVCRWALQLEFHRPKERVTVTLLVRK